MSLLSTLSRPLTGGLIGAPGGAAGSKLLLEDGMSSLLAQDGTSKLLISYGKNFADSKLSDLVAAPTIEAADILYLVKGDQSHKTTVSDLRTALSEQFVGVSLKRTGGATPNLNLTTESVLDIWNAAEWDEGGWWVTD
ncbi:MAG: hypothetical protein HRU14_18400, partial [Planctomycetes bacterium]|nr:hypothetical protein [Planctomycetota bacterium]